MNKIEEIRDELCRKTFVYAKNKEGEKMTQLVGQNPNGWGKHKKSFNKGFDAAMDMNEQFRNWESIVRSSNPLDNPDLFYYTKGYPYLKNYHWLYRHWIENVYQPNQGTEDERSVATEDAQ